MIEGAVPTEEAGRTSRLANLPISYLVRNTPMKSVFRHLQALNLEKTTLDEKKQVRDGMGITQAKAYS